MAAAFIVVIWLFVLAMRGKSDPENVRRWLFNLRQVVIVLLTVTALSTLVMVVGQGLLGNPDMFIVGNQSTRTSLNWFQPRIETRLAHRDHCVHLGVVLPFADAVLGALAGGIAAKVAQVGLAAVQRRTTMEQEIRIRRRDGS